MNTQKIWFISKTKKAQQQILYESILGLQSVALYKYIIQFKNSFQMINKSRLVQVTRVSVLGNHSS